MNGDGDPDWKDVLAWLALILIVAGIILFGFALLLALLVALLFPS